MSPSPFLLLAKDLVLLPTPWAAEVKSYRTLFRKLHIDPVFCRVAFGDDFEPISWTDEEMRKFLLERDTAKRWNVRGMGDFALAVLPSDGEVSTVFHAASGRLLRDAKEEIRIVTGDELKVLSQHFEDLQWVGYTCVRDATTAGGDISNAGKELPWEEMVEVRYGMDPDFRGRGIATRAIQIAMDWAVEEHSTRRFVGDTLKANHQSQKLLKRVGFQHSDTRYLGDSPNVIEWVRHVS